MRPLDSGGAESARWVKVGVSEDTGRQVPAGPESPRSREQAHVRWAAARRPSHDKCAAGAPGLRLPGRRAGSRAPSVAFDWTVLRVLSCLLPGIPPLLRRAFANLWVFEITERGRGVGPRLNQVTLPSLVPPEKLSPSAVTVISPYSTEQDRRFAPRAEV